MGRQSEIRVETPSEAWIRDLEERLEDLEDLEEETPVRRPRASSAVASQASRLQAWAD